LSDDLTGALNAAFAEHGLGTLSREQVKPLIGQGAPALIVCNQFQCPNSNSEKHIRLAAFRRE
jgi:phosphoglycolate phosphatase-like HAD superfamily hydrolase